jgi:serine/threonine protein phosphatase PrpC
MLHTNLSPSFNFVRDSRIYFSTATGVLITPKHYFIFNVGDSRSILIKDKKLHFSSEDHKPMNDGEKRRIEEAGGRVMIQRINGSLAVSRALGDFEYKQRTDRGDLEQLVSPDPEVTCIERDEQDNYMMVACDGIYDVMSNEEIVEFINDRFTREENEGNICNNLLDLCLYKGSRDNMSSIIISFDKGKVKQDSEKVKEDKQLNEDIRSFVKEYIDRHNGPDSSIHIEGLLEQIQQNGDIVRRCHPDQYGILAKRGLIQNIFESLTSRQSGDSA